MARRLTVALLLAVALFGAGSAPAGADDPSPATTPTRASAPKLAPPSQQQIDDAREALDRLRGQGSPTPTATPPPPARVAGPTVGPRSGSVASRISDEAWWTIGAGLLVLLVASETTRLSVKRAKHRKA